MPPWYPFVKRHQNFDSPIRPPTRKELSYPTYVKDIGLDVHI